MSPPPQKPQTNAYLCIYLMWTEHIVVTFHFKKNIFWMIWCDFRIKFHKQGTAHDEKNKSLDQKVV